MATGMSGRSVSVPCNMAVLVRALENLPEHAQQRISMQRRTDQAPCRSLASNHLVSACDRDSDALYGGIIIVTVRWKALVTPYS